MGKIIENLGKLQRVFIADLPAMKNRDKLLSLRVM